MFGRLKRIKKLNRLLDVIKKTKTKYFFELGKPGSGKWQLVINITDKQSIEFLKKEIRGK